VSEAAVGFDYSTRVLGGEYIGLGFSIMARNKTQAFYLGERMVDKFLDFAETRRVKKPSSNSAADRDAPKHKPRVKPSRTIISHNLF
jgi:hypothetical protein